MSTTSEHSNLESEQKPDTSKVEISNVNKDYQFEDADLVIVSGDEVTFRVHSYQIMAFSRVFRDMILVGRSNEGIKEVILTDKELESSANLSLFLDIAYGKPLISPKEQEDFFKYSDFIPFVLKYDCPSVLELLRTSMNLWLTRNVVSPDHLFCAACHINDLSLATDTIHGAGTWQHLPPPQASDQSAPEGSQEVSMAQGIPGASVLDLSAMPIDVFKSIPDDYKFALLRASRKSSIGLKPDTNWSVIADEFERVFKEIRKPASSKE